jgi:hypothetical protein
MEYPNKIALFRGRELSPSLSSKTLLSVCPIRPNFATSKGKNNTTFEHRQN